MSAYPSPSAALPSLGVSSELSSTEFSRVLSPGLTAVAALLLASLYLLPFFTKIDPFGRRPRDKDGNVIPDGPMGLPLLGMPLLASPTSGLLIQCLRYRLVPVPDALPRAHA